MENILFHLGYPKCSSTTIQRSFFEKNDHIFYGGLGINDNISYCNNDIEFIFECLLKYAKHTFYYNHREWAKETVKALLDKVSKNKKIVFSSEVLSVSFTGQILDTHQKLERIRELFEGYNINFLVVIRNQLDLIQSLYKEFVKMGLTISYSEFIKYIWIYQDRSILNELDYADTIDIIKTYFPASNIKIMFFEDITKNVKTINTELSDMLGIPEQNMEINNDNPSLSDSQAYHLLQYNLKFRLGETMMDNFANHRNRVLIHRLNPLALNDEIFGNVLAKRKALAETENMPPIPNATSLLFELNASALSSYNQMNAFYKKTNQRLKEKLHITLPDAYTK